MTKKPSPEPLLKTIAGPEDLRRLKEDRLPGLAQEIREYLIDTVARTGGHLSAGLGTVELTLALHYVFDTPRDRLVWDVGHQTYPHKILTGRRERMGTLRQKDGLSGFPRREESEYDTFGTGHSSTSVSAALGKNPGMDRARGKSTYPAVLGLAEAKARARALHAQALESLAPLGDNGGILAELAGFIIERRQ